MISCSKQLVYSAENLKNPASAGILFAEAQAEVVSAQYGGAMTFSVGVVRVPGRAAQLIKNLYAGVAENYSYVRKSYNPINTIKIFGAVEANLQLLLSSIIEPMIQTTNLNFNDSPVNDYATAQTLKFDVQNVDKYPNNKISFRHDPATLTLPYAPRFLKFGGSIFDRLTYLGGVSFIDVANPSNSIQVPQSFEYLLLFLSSVAPTPISQYRPTASNISVLCNVNFDLVEV